MTHILGRKALKNLYNQVHLVSFFNSMVISTHHLGGGELIWFLIFINFSTRKAQMTVGMTSVFKKDLRTHPKRNEQPETTTLATIPIHFRGKFLSWIVALASLVEKVWSHVSILLLYFVASLWKSEVFSLFLKKTFKKCDKSKYVIIFIQIKLVITELDLRVFISTHPLLHLLLI